MYWRTSVGNDRSILRSCSVDVANGDDEHGEHNDAGSDAQDSGEGAVPPCDGCSVAVPRWTMTGIICIT